MSGSKELSIIIVNWKSVAYLRKCLDSIYSNPPQLRYEIIVIDNASEDGCGAMLASVFPQVIYIESRKNLGFAGANNLAFQHSSGSRVLFLNPDTEITPGALGTLIEALDTNSDAAVVGARLLNTDHSLQDSCIQSFPTILNQLLDFDYLRRKFQQSDFFATRPLFNESNSLSEVDCVSGACMLVKREVFSSVGMFSTRYFMYTEDVDLCYKIKHAGWSVLYIGNARIIHHGGRSSAFSPQNNFATVAMRESRWRFMTAWYGYFYAIMYRISMGLSAIIRVAMLVIAMPFSREREHRFKLLCSARKWIKVLRWSLGLEAWVKQNGMKVLSA